MFPVSCCLLFSILLSAIYISVSLLCFSLVFLSCFLRSVFCVLCFPLFTCSPFPFMTFLYSYIYIYLVKGSLPSPPHTRYESLYIHGLSLAQVTLYLGRLFPESDVSPRLHHESPGLPADRRSCRKDPQYLQRIQPRSGGIHPHDKFCFPQDSRRAPGIAQPRYRAFLGCIGSLEFTPGILQRYYRTAWRPNKPTVPHPQAS